MNVDGSAGKELRELKNGLQDENRRNKDVGGGEEQNLVGKDELKANGVVDVMKEGHGEASQPQSVTPLPQQQPQGVCWERFLNLRSLKVLLVENDDSTRHVVSALLRNCSYEVIEVANGLQAWKILEDLSNHVDLVLTEVVMPCISGVGLLTKIMSHKSCKNIPVIMMSSHDSMGLVFKCLSKGAVDFLVKPIRKNELKNLWQHVWRRCHSSSGSGSESGTQTQKSVRSKTVEKSDNNTGSNDEDGNGSIGLNAGDGSDSGSGIQSSWTKQVVEVDSPRSEAPWDQIPGCPDSTCTQVIHSKAEICGRKQFPAVPTIECKEQKEKPDNTEMGKDLEIGMPKNLDLQLEYRDEFPTKVVGSKQANPHGIGSSKLNKEITKRQLDLNSDSMSNKLKFGDPNLTGVTITSSDPHIDNTEFGAPNRISMISENKAIGDPKGSSSLELSLKRLREGKDVDTTIHDDRNVLQRSDSSAFSRYNTASNAVKTPTANVGSNSLHDNSSDIVKQESTRIIRSFSSRDHANQCLASGGNNFDMGSTTNNAPSKPVLVKNKSAPSMTVESLNPAAGFQPLKNDICAPPLKPLDKASGSAAMQVCTKPRNTHHGVQGQHFHYYERPCQLIMQQQLTNKQDDLALKTMAAAAPHCGSSNVLGGPCEGNIGNYSVNRSATGSNFGSNGQNGSSIGVNAGGTNGESDNGIAGESGRADGSGSGSGTGTGNRVDQNNSSQREAALNKFRQKRKERCFRKKVRYQSRKRLAEQRPRVRGQFVRKTVDGNSSTANESTSGDTDG